MRPIECSKFLRTSAACPPQSAAMQRSVSTSAASYGKQPERYAVIGGGIAGLAAAWHLLAARRDAPDCPAVSLHLYEAHGLGAGGSGAAAGLLHPYTPRGKLLWRGMEAFADALFLTAAAESAAAKAAAAAGETADPFTWHHGILRPARSIKQARDLARFLPLNADAAAAAGAELLDGPAMAQLVPGLQPDLLLPGLAAEAAACRQAAMAGLMVREAVVLNPVSYMGALWTGCCQAAAETGGGAELRRESVRSLAALEEQAGPYDGMVLAAGAAVETVAEATGLLPLELCQGHTLHMRPGSSNSDGRQQHDAACSSNFWPASAPSLLGSPYIAAHGRDSLVVGATKAYGLTPDQAYAQCAAPVVTDLTEAATATEALLPPAAALWPPLSSWRVTVVVSGVRALPTRGADGSIPYLGRLPAAGSSGQQRNWWLVGGLGARGLVYHAWLGRLVARALLLRSEEGLPPELLRWKTAVQN